MLLNKLKKIKINYLKDAQLENIVISSLSFFLSCTTLIYFK